MQPAERHTPSGGGGGGGRCQPASLWPSLCFQSGEMNGARKMGSSFDLGAIFRTLFSPGLTTVIDSYSNDIP